MFIQALAFVCLYAFMDKNVYGKTDEDCATETDSMGLRFVV